MSKKSKTNQKTNPLSIICLLVVIVGATLAFAGLFLNVMSIEILGNRTAVDENAFRYISENPDNLSAWLTTGIWLTLILSISIFVYTMLQLLAAKIKLFRFLRLGFFRFITLGATVALLVVTIMFIVGASNPMTGLLADTINNNIFAGIGPILSLIGGIIAVLGGIGVLLVKVKKQK